MGCCTNLVSVLLFVLGIGNVVVVGADDVFLILGGLHMTPIVWKLIFKMNFPAMIYLLYCVVSLVFSAIELINIVQTSELLKFGDGGEENQESSATIASGNRLRALGTVVAASLVIVRQGGKKDKEDPDAGEEDPNNGETFLTKTFGLSLDPEILEILVVAIPGAFVLFTLVQCRNTYGDMDSDSLITGTDFGLGGGGGYSSRPYSEKPQQSGSSYGRGGGDYYASKSYYDTPEPSRLKSLESKPRPPSNSFDSTPPEGLVVQSDDSDSEDEREAKKRSNTLDTSHF